MTTTTFVALSLSGGAASLSIVDVLSSLYAISNKPVPVTVPALLTFERLSLCDTEIMVITRIDILFILIGTTVSKEGESFVRTSLVSMAAI